MAADSPVAVALARPVLGAKLPPEWAESLKNGQMAVESDVVTAVRLTQLLTAERNVKVAQSAQKWVVAYANPGGLLDGQVNQWRLAWQQVDLLWVG
ncbi:MAG: hypothetical protein H7293_05600 [Candidatus Saccharibacteria bacterium]|nr:hypothetical protein [Rhodoferax sp.]